MACQMKDCPSIKAPETHPITMTNDDYLLRPSNALDERISHSSPSSPLLRRKSVKKNRRCSSFRSSNSTKKERKVSKLPTPPNSPRSLLQSVKSRLYSQKPSPPPLVLPSPPTISPPSIKVSPIDPDVSPPSPPFIQVSSDIPLTPPSTPCTRASCTDNKRENEGTTHIIAIPGGGEGQNLVPNQLRADPSISSMESGYSTDASRQSKLSLDSRGSVSNILEDSEDKNQHRASCDPTVNQGDTRTIPESFSNSVGSTTAPVEKPQVVDASDKHMHPKSRFRIGPSSNAVVKILSSISERSPTNQASDSPSPDSSTSPANSITSSSSSTTSSSSSLISSSVSPASSRRSSISYSSFRKSRRFTLSRSPSLKSRDLAHRRTSFKRQRASLTSVTKFYRVTPKQYLKTSRATSALNISEVMSDDEGSVTSSLRRLHISIPGTQHAKSDKECSHKSHEGLTGKQQDLVEAKAKQKPPKGGGAKLSQSLPQHFGSSSPLPWAGSSHDNADKDMKTWFQKEVRELKRKMERKLAKCSRDCRKMRREVKEYKDRVCRCRSSSNSSAGAADHAQSSASCLHRERSVCSTRTSYTPTLHSPTLQTVKQPEELPCQRVDRAVIRDLSQDLLLWVWPARSLGLDDSDIQRIKLDYAGDSREQSYQMLSVWLQRCPCDATYQTLGHVLLTEASSVYPRYVDIVSKHCL